MSLAIKNNFPTSSLPGTSSGFQIYQIFLALKSHFKNEGYDYRKYNGKVTASFDAYMKRKDRFFFEKIAKNTNKADIEDLIIANFVYCENGLDPNPEKVWIGDLAASEGKEKFLKYRARVESLEYNFKKDLTVLTHYAKIQDDINSSSQFPAILSLYFDGKISAETVIILDLVLNIFSKWNSALNGDPLWNRTEKFLRKYKSLIIHSLSDISKYRKIMIQYAKSETT